MRFRFTESSFRRGDWMELCVVLDGDEFTERAFDLPDELRVDVPIFGAEPAGRIPN